MTITLMCAPSQQWDIEMGTFASLEAARAGLEAAKAEWDAQGGNAAACRWYAWDDDLRRAVAPLSEAQPYPPGRSGISASEALDGPREQKIRDLESIIEECEGWGTDEATALADEAREYLAELA